MRRRSWLKSFLSHCLKIFTIGFLVACLAVVYVRKIEPDWLALVQVPVTLPNLAPAFNGYRIVQITDIHADPWMTRDRLTRIVNLINQQKPDLVALTGDYITRDPEKYVATLTALKALTPRDQVVAVLGNHDVWTNPQLITQVLQDANVTVLENQVYQVNRDRAFLQIAGLGDVWTKQDRLDLIEPQVSATGGAILLAHEPDFADTSAATGRFALQLSGHSHGGQVYLPFVKRVLPLLSKRYPAGKYQVGKMIQYTNRGVGMARPRVRFNCRPEITVLTLKAG